MAMETMGLMGRSWETSMSYTSSLKLDDEQMRSEFFSPLEEGFLDIVNDEQRDMQFLLQLEEHFNREDEFHNRSLQEESLLQPKTQKCPLLDPEKEPWWSVWSHNKTVKPPVVGVPPQADESFHGLNDFTLKFDKDFDREEFYVMVNPKTGSCVNSPEKPAPVDPLEPQRSIQPYHISHDHDYVSIKKEDDNDNDGEAKVKMEGIERYLPSEDEPDVDVWEIDNFCHKQTSKSVPVTDKLPDMYRQMYLQRARRSSARAAEMKRREQDRKFSNAVHAKFKTAKPQRRPYKNIKPKNSVETTPSQSDIEEFYSQPVRPTCTRITKKKTCKGRIDHSESERHRREVLRTNFSLLADLIPNKYLRGDKASSQISKQKILTGAKAFIVAMHFSKGSYKFQNHKNKNWRKKFHKFLKSLKSTRKIK